MKFIFSPPADDAGGLLGLPWALPLAEWEHPSLFELRTAGLHRHVVRFVADGDRVFVLKELPEELARREYRLLRELAEASIPAVHVLGACLDRGGEAILVTRYLEYSATYRHLLTNAASAPPRDALVGGMVELLVRLHLGGFLWGDCSLSNTLFKPDAGDVEAYLVDAETMERHPSLTDGQRALDLSLAHERIAGELLDLHAGGLLAEDLDPLETAEEIIASYHALWTELTREDFIGEEDQQYRIRERMRRIEELGFDVEEVELIAGADGSGLRIRTRVAEPGRWRRILMMRTGLDVQDNQARRLLGDIGAFRAWLEYSSGRPVSEVVATSRWLSEVYDPVVTAIPARLREKREEPEVFHEVLELRGRLSEEAGRDVCTEDAVRAYFEHVLPGVPTERIQPGGS